MAKATRGAVNLAQFSKHPPHTHAHTHIDTRARHVFTYILQLQRRELHLLGIGKGGSACACASCCGCPCVYVCGGRTRHVTFVQLHAAHVINLASTAAASPWPKSRWRRRQTGLMCRGLLKWKAKPLKRHFNLNTARECRREG